MPSLDSMLGDDDADGNDDDGRTALDDEQNVPVWGGRDRAQSQPVSCKETALANESRRISFFSRRSRSSTAAKRRSTLNESGWEFVSRQRSSAIGWLAKEQERWEDKEQAFTVLLDFFGATSRAWEAEHDAHTKLVGSDGPSARALHVASTTLAGLRAEEKAEEQYAAEMLRLSVAVPTDLASGDDTAAAASASTASATTHLHSAAKASSDRSLRLASEARERALRLNQSAGQLAAVEAAVRSEVREAAKTLHKQRAPLLKQQATVEATFGDLQRAHEKQQQRRAATSQLQSSGGTIAAGADLWLLAHTFLRAAQSHAHEAKGLAGPMAATRDGLGASAERLMACASFALAPELPVKAAAPAAVTASAAAAPSASAAPLVPDNPFTARSGVCSRHLDGVLRSSWLQEWAVLTAGARLPFPSNSIPSLEPHCPTNLSLSFAPSADRTLHLFSCTPSELLQSHGLPPAKPALTLDCASGGTTARAWTPKNDAADDGDGATTVWFTPSSRVTLTTPATSSRSPVTQRLWAKLGRSASTDTVRHELEFGSAVDASEWLEALSGGAPTRLSVS